MEVCLAASKIASWACGCPASGITTTSQYTLSVSSGSYSLCLSAFGGLSSSGNGGAVSITDTNGDLKVIKSIFSSCYSSGYGGGMAISSNTSLVCQTCGSSCYCASYGQFYSASTSNSNSYGSFSQISVTQCSPTSTGTYHAIAHYYNYISAASINSTFNRCSDVASGAYFYYSGSQQKAIYWNVFGCISGIRGVLQFQCSGSMNFSSSNVVNNTMGGSTGIFYMQQATTVNIMNCVITGNNNGALFYSDAGSMNVINCFINHSSTITAAYVTISGCTYGVTSSYGFNFHIFSLSSIGACEYIERAHGYSGCETSIFTFGGVCCSFGGVLSLGLFAVILQ